jgi:transcriptional regulator with XRE-family HTH domain
MVRGNDSEFAELRVFGDNLRRARTRAKLTQVQLSMTAPFDRAAISRVEHGERAPDLPTLLRLSRALDVKPTDLLRGLGPANSPRRAPTHDKSVKDDPAGMFGANLRWARNRAKISQERLALDADVDRAAISVYENGGREPNLRTVLKLARRLEVRPALLLQGISWQSNGRPGRRH